MGGINEYIDIYSINKQKRIIRDMNLHWTSSKENISDQIVMRFHLDRDRKRGGYGYKEAESIVRTFKLIVKRYLVYIMEIPEMIRVRKHKQF